MALIAFNEAIDRYIPERGNFASFAELVINRRLTDELRKEYRVKGEIATSPEILSGEGADPETDTFGSEVSAALREQALMEHSEKAHTAKDEIEEVQEILKSYGFSFFDLVDCSPKADKTKKECAKAVAALLEDEELFAGMRSKKTLPAKELIKKSGVKNKILERHRKYIIAAAEILNGEYPLLAEYMSYIRKALKT